MSFEGKLRTSEPPGLESAVRQCLNHILQSAAFRTGSRPKQFLSFVVERKLEGRQDEIKERTIGTEVFGRTPDFETSGDSIVRVNANEVRRRLAQYYRDLPQPNPILIVLPHGSYVPEFVVAAEAAAPAEKPAIEAPAIETSAALPVAAPSRLGRRGIWLACIAAVAAAGALWWMLSARASAFDLFWAPVLDVQAAPVICLPTTNTFQLKPEAARVSTPPKPGEIPKLDLRDVQAFHNWHTSLPVLHATLSVSLALQRKGRTSLIRMGNDLKMDELRGHPVIAIGSFSNPWTQQNVAGLRFTFDRGPSDTDPPRIRDSRNPQRSWSLPQVYPDPQDRDFAIVTRTLDPATREPFVSLAGLHSFGCQVAGEFVSQESYWKEVARRAPAGWEKKNLQIVLETKVIGTTTSAPKIADLYIW